MKAVIVVGGGLAGAAAGTLLARDGADVTIVEREAEVSHKICGEFLSIEAQAYLRNLGLDAGRLGGHPIAKLRMVRGRNCVDTDLPFQGIGISRRLLDEALLEHAATCGARVIRGQSVTVAESDGVTRLQLSSGAVMRPQTMFLATGKHDIRGQRRQAPPPEDLVGFKMYFRLSPLETERLSGFVALILLRDGYAGLQLVEDGQANLCLLVKRNRLLRVGGKWATLLDDLCCESRWLGQTIVDATPLLEQPLTIYRVPYGFVHQARDIDSRNIFRLGDQVAVIPSFTGDGMALALHSATLASAIYLRGGDATDYHRQMAGDVASQIRRAHLLYRAASHHTVQGLLFRIAAALPISLQYAASLTRIRTKSRLSPI